MNILILHIDQETPNDAYEDLFAHGHTPHTVGSILDAKLWITSHKTELIIAPLRAADEDVFGLLTWVRENQFTAEVPFVFLCTNPPLPENKINAAYALTASDILILDGWNSNHFLSALMRHFVISAAA